LLERAVLENLRVVLMTTVPGRKLANEVAGQSNARVVVKPVRMASLRDALHSVPSSMHAIAALPELVPAAAPSAASVSEVAGGDVDSAAPRLLVAEDNPVNQRVIQALLARAGLTCDVVSSGRQAVLAAASRCYALVLMDVHLAELSGHEATALIRALEKPGEHLPILAMTAGTTPEEWQRCLEAGMDGFLAKPLRTAELQAVLQKWLAAAPDAAAECVAPAADRP
jgi:hypothetical protein